MTGLWTCLLGCWSLANLPLCHTKVVMPLNKETSHYATGTIQIIFVSHQDTKIGLKNFIKTRYKLWVDFFICFFLDSDA